MFCSALAKSNAYKELTFRGATRRHAETRVANRELMQILRFLPFCIFVRLSAVFPINYPFSFSSAQLLLPTSPNKWHSSYCQVQAIDLAGQICASHLYALTIRSVDILRTVSR